MISGNGDDIEENGDDKIVWWKAKDRNGEEDEEYEEEVKNPLRWWAVNDKEEMKEENAHRREMHCNQSSSSTSSNHKGDQADKGVCDIENQKNIETAREGTQEPKSRESPEKHKKIKEKGRGPGT